MKLLRSARRLVCDGLVNLSPNLFLDSLRRNHYEVVAREFNRAHLFDWSKAKIPPKLEEFEDMVPLFALSPMSRGIIRQDFDEAAALFKAIKSLPEAYGVEIGRFNGGSTVLLAAAIGNRGRLVSVDIAPQDDSTLTRILTKAKLADRVDLIIGDANQVQTDRKYDFVFIDGDHTYLGAKRDHNRWGAMVKPGGLIIHHDMADSRPFSTQWNDLARLRNDILLKQGKELELMDEVGSLAIFKKRNCAWSDI